MVALFADAHADTRVMARALAECRRERVDTVALLGDLFDRPEQADRCVETLSGWNVVGVYGNHEHDTVLAAAAGELELRPETLALLSELRDELLIDGVCFQHEAPRWGLDDPLARVLGRGADADDPASRARLTFAGHTHFRQARDERGPLDIARGTLRLDPARRYLVNPGALSAGQFAIWDRDNDTICFKHVERWEGTDGQT